MSELVMTDAYVSINNTVVSNHVTSVSLPIEVEKLETTSMGATYRTYVPGFKTARVVLNLNQDYAANSIDATLYPLVGNATAFPIEVRPLSSNRSATNPGYQGNACLYNYDPLNSSVGQISKTTVTLELAGALTRNVTP